MEIKADKEGLEAIHQMANIALKTGGLQNLQAVQNILSQCELLEEGPILNKDKISIQTNKN